MKADTVDLAAVFVKPVRYLVPMFQRPYVWSREKEWEPLWDDIRTVLERQLDNTPHNDSLPHFMGAVVLDQVMTQVGMIEARWIIDGQQRLATLQLFIAAARSLALERGLKSQAAMLEKLIFNDPDLVRAPDQKFKVQPTALDVEAFRAMLLGVPAPSADGRRIVDAFAYFREVIDDWLREGDDADGGTPSRLDVLSTVLWKLLLVVAIDLDEKDNAQVIFETLNARGTPLLAADLIKNHIFQAAVAEGANINQLYVTYWRELDSDYWRANVQQGRFFRPRLDIFMNHWLAMKLGREVVSHLLFPDFKRYLAARGGSITDLLADVHRYAGVYRSFEEAGPDTAKARFFYRLNTMETTTAYPVLLWLYGPDGLHDEGELDQATGVIESWLVRRMLVRATTKNYNVVFLALLNSLAKNPSASSAEVENFFRNLSGDSQYWPTDAEVERSLNGLPAYTSLTRGRLRMVLEAIELARRTTKTEAVALPKDLTIEHILPQEWRPNWSLPDRADDAAAAERDLLKQTIGNLTLVTGKLNPSMSNAAWPQKKAALGRHSVLILSYEVRTADRWDEDAILARTHSLIRSVLRIWPGPSGVTDNDESPETFEEGVPPNPFKPELTREANGDDWVALLSAAVAGGDKSDVMCRLFERGLNIADVSRLLSVPYNVAYAAHRSWIAEREG